MGISQIATDFVQKCVNLGELDSVDKIYTQNKLIHILNLKEFDSPNPSEDIDTIDRLDLLDQLLDYAVSKGIIDDNASERDVLGSAIMDLMTPLPSVVNDTFWSLYENDKKDATDYFYTLSSQNNYIKSREIAQNIEFTHPTEYGELQMTINLSKPEKTSKEIAEAKNIASNYPLNMLVDQNEGFYGHLGHPGRSNHRIIRLMLDGEDEWGFQYSPYSYYNEHAIFLSMEHRPMLVGLQAVRNLLNILQIFPHYFVGSNAGLPIVGGSILSHDHYQGGRHDFPLDSAESYYDFEIEGVNASLVKWPMSVVRLKDSDRHKVAKAAEIVFDAWQDYTNEELDILAYSDETPHNAITPLTRKDGEDYVLDLVLRNNRTNEDYPDGIFHPHPHVQHIKKENIGLIEVLGLAILPPRLKKELEDVKKFLVHQTGEVAEVHQEWVNNLVASDRQFTEETIDAVIEEEVGQIFLEVLKNAGVFKTDEKGTEAFIKFADELKAL